jgi:hypothetical protein
MARRCSAWAARPNRLCRGNIRSHYATSGGCERIFRQVFGRLTGYQVFLLKYMTSGLVAPGR